MHVQYITTFTENVSIAAAFGILVRRCFAFDESETSLQLVDDRGCRAEKLISEFVYDDEAGTADATIYSMFRCSFLLCL